jgi:Fic family protein
MEYSPMTSQILSVTENKVPSVIGLSSDSNLVIGDAARDLGLQGRTNTYHFKPELGKIQDDSLYAARISRGGQKLHSKSKPYWVSSPDINKRETFTPLEATQAYLERLIPKDDVNPRQIIIGEPSLDEKWRENYRKNIRQVLANMGYESPIFFPEPFAVYQYYRHAEGLISNTDEQKTVLVVDFGGGTFDCCVIRTTKTGELARSGAHSLPLGTQSLLVAGEAVDIELLNVTRDIAKASGIIFKDDPIARARKSAQSLWIVEDVKIRLSKAIEQISSEDDKMLLGIVESMRLPPGSFHMDEEVNVKLNGKHLHDVVTKLWNREWGKALISCHQESEQKLDMSIECYDIVLVAGGSAKLPFLTNLIRKTLPNQLKSTQINIGNYAGAAVAKGIAVECKEQADKRPSLVNNRLVSCLLNNMYIRCGRNKSERIAPKVKHTDTADTNNEGLVYKSPGLLEDNVIKCKLELQNKPRGTLFFWFHGTPTGHDAQLNMVSNSIRIHGDSLVDRKIDLELRIEAGGMVTPLFTFTRQGNEAHQVKGQPFNLGTNQVEGQVFLGVDFGTCNSYVARFVVPTEEVKQASYPEYEVNRDTKDKLLKLEQRCQELRKQGILNKENLIKHANRNELDFVFHSNKIEGNTLSRGETELALKSTKANGASKSEQEAVNLRNAYRWVIETYYGCNETFSLFVREVNKKLLDGIEEKAGVFRTVEVTLSRVAYIPPPWGSVDEFISQLGKEVNLAQANTSGLELAVRVHTKFVAIHPFVDGNGRTARLLIAAILLNSDLPVLVLNADDKERYLSALGRSNDGSLDSLLNFYMEIMEQTLQELEDLDQGEIGSLDLTGSVQDDNLLPTKEELSTEAGDNKKSLGRLLSILKKKKNERKEAQVATYSAWRSAFEMFRNEVASYITGLDTMDEFQEAGYDIKFNEFDIVNEYRFDEFWARRNLSHTWFCSLTICNGIECYGLMFQFARCSDTLRALDPATAPVTCTLAIGGQITGAWMPVGEEPINLREIGYANGRLIYMDYDGKLVMVGLNDILNELIADLLVD